MAGCECLLADSELVLTVLFIVVTSVKLTRLSLVLQYLLQHW